MLLFNIKTVWIITTIFVSIGFTGMFILYNIDKKKDNNKMRENI